MRGLAEILFAPPLTMQQEFARGQTWKNWRGPNKFKTFDALREWDYVWRERAVEGGPLTVEGKSFPDRDHRDGYRGLLLADFRQKYVQQVMDLDGPEELYPTLEEVAAGRLYTGPAYTQINNFLRLVGNVEERHWRARLAQVEGFTYSSTVGHLVSLIRKGTKIEGLKHRRRLEQGGERAVELLLYRSVGGKLPDSFFVPDIQGMLCAVDCGFSSTSTDRAASVKFMDPNQPCLLLVLHCDNEPNSAGHLQVGAVLTGLSQFPDQAEILFPPLSMFQVMKKPGGAAGEFWIEDKTETVEMQNGSKVEVAFKEIHVVPLFV